MWYEILPSFFIVTAGLGLPGWGLYHIHNLTLGNHFRRSLHDRWDRAMYQRDMRLTGNPYEVNVCYWVVASLVNCWLPPPGPTTKLQWWFKIVFFSKNYPGLDSIPDEK